MRYIVTSDIVTSGVYCKYQNGEVQCTRTATLAAFIFELLPFVDFSCPEHSFNSITGMYLKFSVQIDINVEKCSAQEL